MADQLPLLDRIQQTLENAMAAMRGPTAEQQKAHQQGMAHMGGDAGRLPEDNNDAWNSYFLFKQLPDGDPRKLSAAQAYIQRQNAATGMGGSNGQPRLDQLPQGSDAARANDGSNLRPDDALAYIQKYGQSYGR